MKWLKGWFGRASSAVSPVGAAAPHPQDVERAPADVRDEVASLLVRGEAAAAREVAQAACDRYPGDVAMNVLCGSACLASGKAEEALDAFHLALHYDPGDEAALNGQVAALETLGRSDEIGGAYQEFLVARPDHAGALLALARLASAAGRHERAAELLERALARHPEDVAVLNDLGLLVAREFADFGRGEALLRRALERSPGANYARTNLGWVLCEQRAYDEGFRLLDEAIARDSGDKEARLIRALSRLKRGDFATGWDDYEARFASPTARPRPFRFPAWNGTPLGTDRLLVYGEQGLGDQIMFASCLPEVLARAPDCVVECEPRLGALFARSFPAARVVTAPLNETEPDWLGQVAPIGRQIALGSLPGLFRRRLRDFPAHAGYLRADPARVRAWRERLAVLGPAPRIGISWRGGSKTSRRSLRSLDLTRLGPLLAGQRAAWVSLQYGDCRAELAALAREGGVTVHHWQEAIDDYEETAALVCALDLVVSVCTSIIHLSGSLAQHALVMVPYAAEWRYGAEGDAMPWYPTVRLLRQRNPDRWEDVFEALRGELLTRTSAIA